MGQASAGLFAAGASFLVGILNGTINRTLWRREFEQVRASEPFYVRIVVKCLTILIRRAKCVSKSKIYISPEEAGGQGVGQLFLSSDGMKPML